MSNEYGFTKYLQHGLSVIPVYGITGNGVCGCGISDCGSPGKHPPINWRTYTKERMTPWAVANYSQNEYNVGIVTGAISGVMVLDIDGELPDDFPVDDIPPTWIAKTAKGRHIYFKHEDGIGNRAKIGGHDIDIRGEGGYVVAPPSIHYTGVCYDWENEPDTHKLYEMPKSIHEWVEKNSSPKIQPPIIPHSYKPAREYNEYINAAFDSERDILASTSQGGRNDQLNKSAFALSTTYIPWP